MHFKMFMNNLDLRVYDSSNFTTGEKAALGRGGNETVYSEGTKNC